ncbi:MAG: hypothetical protein OEY34_10055 [Cyclobacteriaceae bacterium]|nr:hypothetical protein [Cyclobacteriaceae bacterium]
MSKYIYISIIFMLLFSRVYSQELSAQSEDKKDTVREPNQYILIPYTLGMKKGNGYYKNNELVWSELGVGITKNIHISTGFIGIAFFQQRSPVWISSTISVPLLKEKVYISLLGATGTFLSEKSSIGAALGLISFGSPTRNVSVGYGRGFKEIKDGFLGWNQVTLNKIIGSERVVNDLVSFTVLWKTGKKGYWITDNLLLLEKSAYPTSYSILARRRVFSVFSLDYGLMIPIIKSDLEYALPWLGFRVPF